MATELRLRRGTTDEHGNFIGAEAEATVDTDKNTVVVHDGQTQGGFPLAQESDTAPAVDSVATLRTSSFPENLERLWLSGYYGVGTAGGGPLYRDSSDTTTADNSGTVFVDEDGVRWKRPDVKSADVTQFGAKGDGAADDYSAVNAAVQHVEGLDDEQKVPVFFPAGKFNLSQQIKTSVESIRFVGSGRGSAFSAISGFRGGTQLIYTGTALASDEGVFEFGESADQCRGPQVTEMTIDCQGNANGIHGQRTNQFSFTRLLIANPVVGIVLSTASFSGKIAENIIWDPVTGGGGIDLRDDTHRCAVRDNSLINDSGGTREPKFGIRVAEVANCSAVTVDNNNFDFYRVTDAHYRLGNDCRGGSFINNYIEKRDDGKSASLLELNGGGGFHIAGNRLSVSGTDTTIAINIFGTGHDIAVIANYFSGVDNAVRMASGATNVFVGGGNQRDGLVNTLLLNQNAAGSKSSVEIEGGTVRADNYATY